MRAPFIALICAIALAASCGDSGSNSGTGHGGITGSDGSAGTTGSAGVTGTAGTVGNAGTTGSGGSGGAGGSGATGTGGASGSTDFACGTIRCQLQTQYCFINTGPGSSSSAHCATLPDSCQPTPSCACLFGFPCTGDAAHGLTVMVPI